MSSYGTGGDDYYDQSRGDNFLPHDCKETLRIFHEALKNKDEKELHDIYEDDFPALTQKYYKASSWPPAETVQEHVTKDNTFICLYKETYFRHIYSKLQPTIHDRFDSFQNYINLFNIFLQLNNNDPQLILPVVWLWDIIDEFVYQFQSFHEYRTVTRELSAEERRMLKDHVHVWSAQTVIRYLSAFVEKKEHALQYGKAKLSPNNIFCTLSEYSLVAQCQVMCLISDYTSALEALKPLNLSSKTSAFIEVQGCHTSLYYFMGFAYLMLRRYRDAIDVFSMFLLSRDKMPLFEGERMQKANHMRSLLGIALSFCPQDIDDSLLQSVKDKLSHNFENMQKGEANAFEEVFLNCCPRFISPFTPNYDSNVVSVNPMELQARLLKEEIKQRDNFAKTYNVLKMCTSMGMDTLAEATKSDSETLSTYLLNIKHKTRNKRHKSLASTLGAQKSFQDPSSGDWIGEPQLNFYISEDMVFVGEMDTEKSHGGYFIRQTLKLEGIIDYIDDNIVFKSGTPM